MCIPYSAYIAGVVVVGVGWVVTSSVASGTGHVDRNGYDDDQHSADNGSYIESNAEAGQNLLYGSRGPRGYNGQDEGRYGAEKADEGGTTEQQDYGE